MKYSEKVYNTRQVFYRSMVEVFGKDIALDALDLVNEHRPVDELMDRMSKLIGGVGVEAVRGEKGPWDRYHQDIVMEYVNMGDTYTTTVLYDVHKDKFEVGTMGDWVAANEKKYGII